MALKAAGRGPVFRIRAARCALRAARSPLRAPTTTTRRLKLNSWFPLHFALPNSMHKWIGPKVSAQMWEFLTFGSHPSWTFHHETRIHNSYPVCLRWSIDQGYRLWDLSPASLLHCSALQMGGDTKGEKCTVWPFSDTRENIWNRTALLCSYGSKVRFLENY